MSNLSPKLIFIASMAIKIKNQRSANFSCQAILCVKRMTQQYLIRLDQPDDKVRYDGKAQKAQG